MSDPEAFAQQAAQIARLQAEAEQGNEQAQREIDERRPLFTPMRSARSWLSLTAGIGPPRAPKTSRGSCERSVCQFVM